MKVVISGYIGKKITGIGRNLISLLDHSKSNIQYVIYTNYDMKDEFKFKNPNVIVKTYKISKMSSMKNLLWTTVIFPFIVIKEKADKGLIPNFTLLIMKFKPTVVIMHDLIEFNVPDKFSKKKMFYRTKLADPITARRADKIITVSENSKSDIMKFLNVSENKITVIYNGVDQEKFTKIDTKIADQILISKQWPSNYILYAGTVDHPGKNAFSLVKSFEKLKSEGLYNGKLVLAGMPGAGFEKIKEIIDNSHWAKDIVLTGFITDEELIALYNKCEVFCFLSLYEGFGIPPLEALSCGAKVIVSNKSSLPEVVNDCGWLVDPYCIEDICKTILEALNYQIDDSDKISIHLKKYNWINLSKSFEMELSK